MDFMRVLESVGRGVVRATLWIAPRLWEGVVAIATILWRDGALPLLRRFAPWLVGGGFAFALWGVFPELFYNILTLLIFGAVMMFLMRGVWRNLFPAPKKKGGGP